MSSLLDSSFDANLQRLRACPCCHGWLRCRCRFVIYLYSGTGTRGQPGCKRWYVGYERYDPEQYTADQAVKRRCDDHRGGGATAAGFAKIMTGTREEKLAEAATEAEALRLELVWTGRIANKYRATFRTRGACFSFS